ncbi:MAG: helix-turn-helix domain-containing protein [Dehalococcoidales bacterium]|nr:helix-turn-helix domain-containing protein [Dehalococcoidales bacterium]
MSVIINSQTYYRTTEACDMVGVSRSTLLRWLRQGILKDSSHRDRRGWRLFTQADIKRIEAEANRMR